MKQRLTKGEYGTVRAHLLAVGDLASLRQTTKRLFDTIDALEAELAATEEKLQIIEVLARGGRPLKDENDPRWSPAYLDVMDLCDREKAAIAAARLEEAEWWEHLAPDCGMPPSGNPDCIYCQRLAELRSGITPDQSAARGGASQNESKSFDGTTRLPTGEGQ